MTLFNMSTSFCIKWQTKDIFQYHSLQGCVPHSRASWSWRLDHHESRLVQNICSSDQSFLKTSLSGFVQCHLDSQRRLRSWICKSLLRILLLTFAVVRVVCFKCISTWKLLIIRGIYISRYFHKLKQLLIPV